MNFCLTSAVVLVNTVPLNLMILLNTRPTLLVAWPLNSTSRTLLLPTTVMTPTTQAKKYVSIPKTLEFQFFFPTVVSLQASSLFPAPLYPRLPRYRPIPAHLLPRGPFGPSERYQALVRRYALHPKRCTYMHSSSTTLVPHSSCRYMMFHIFPIGHLLSHLLTSTHPLTHSPTRIPSFAAAFPLP